MKAAPADPALKSPAQLVCYARRFLAREEAEYLAMSFFNLTRSELYLNPQPLAPETVRRFQRLVRRAVNGEPLQYLTNSAPFLDLNLHVDRRVFIPRPETEELAVRTMRLVSNPQIIIDYGTGSGCLAIALARMFPQARVYAIDISPAALTVARINIRRYHLEKNIQLLLAGTLASPELEFLKERVDLLISNPPYIPDDRIPALPPTVRNYEPLVALNGGPGGSAVISMLLRSAPLFLSWKGVLAMEIDETQGRLITSLLPGAWIEPDLNDKIRYAFWQKGVS